MAAWPIAASMKQPLDDVLEYPIYLVGLFWSLLWEPIRKVQEQLSPDWLLQGFTFLVVGILVLMWAVVAALPFLGRWRGRQVIGLWALQTSYAGAQAIVGFFYARDYFS